MLIIQETQGVCTSYNWDLMKIFTPHLSCNKDRLIICPDTLFDGICLWPDLTRECPAFLVWWCRDISWCVTKCHYVRVKDFWWFDNFCDKTMSFIMKCHDMLWIPQQLTSIQRGGSFLINVLVKMSTISLTGYVGLVLAGVQPWVASNQANACHAINNYQAINDPLING